MIRTSKSKVIRANIPSYITQNWKLISLVAVTLFGMLCGSLISRNLSQDGIGSMASIFNSFLQARNSQAFLTSLVNTLLTSFVLPSCTVLFGLSVIGFPIVATIPFFQGMGIGMISTYIYATYGLHGIGYCALVFFPGKVLQCAALVFFCKEGMTMSYGLFNVSRGTSKNFDIRKEMKLYIARITVFYIITAIGAGVEALLSLVFGTFFQF